MVWLENGNLHISSNTRARALKLGTHLGGIIMVWFELGHLHISATTFARDLAHTLDGSINEFFGKFFWVQL